MRDRERFETKAIECGATVINANATVLVVKSTDNALLTTYIFDENGNFKDYYTKKCWQKILERL